MALIRGPRISAYGLNVRPSDGAFAYIFEAGTTTPKTTYSIPAMTAGYEQEHPVVSDSRGVFPAMYTDGTFKIVIKDPSGNTIYTDDNQSGGAGDVQIKGNFSSTTNSSNYPVSGDLGDWYRVTESFTLAAASGSHELVAGDFIVANKNGAAALDADWDIYLGRESRQFAVDFDAKGLIINVASNTTLSCSFDGLSLLNSNYLTKYLRNKSYTFNIEGVGSNLEAGTTEKASTWYQLWIDSDETLKLVPDLTGTADANVANSLSCSTLTAITDLVHAWDEIYQTTDNTKGYVKAVSAEGLLTCQDIDGADLDLFPDGNETFIIRKMTPVGLGSFKARVGAAYNNASSYFNNSGYTCPELQEPKEYSEEAGDFTLSTSNWTTNTAKFIIYQVHDQSGIPIWRGRLFFTGALSSPTAGLVLVISGVNLNSNGNQFFIAGETSGTNYTIRAIIGTSTSITILVSGASSNFSGQGDFEFLNKPTFHL